MSLRGIDVAPIPQRGIDPPPSRKNAQRAFLRALEGILLPREEVSTLSRNLRKKSEGDFEEGKSNREKGRFPN
jgi:hypothetical protein